MWEFRALNDSTWYLAIRSFQNELKPQLDSLYNTVIPQITQKKFLVLDISDNDGGAENNYYPLLPLIYNQPLEPDEMAIWLSPDNIKSYEQRQPPDQQLIARMKAALPYSFLYLNASQKKKWDMQGTVYPRKVAILYNRHTASAAEALIAYAMQSSKVITLGENSGGFVDYGDIRTKEIPCGKFILRTTVTKWKDKSKYEFVGIPPMISLHKGSDRIKAATDKLSKNPRRH